MHRSRNAFVEIERDRREAARQAMFSRFPEIAEAEARIVVVDEEIERLRADIRRRNVTARRRRPADDPATQKIAELKKERRAIVGLHDPAADSCQCLRCRRRAAYANPELRDVLNAIEEEAKAREKALYSDRVVSWSNFNAVRQSVGNIRSGPPPKFVPWTEDRGRVVVQIQGGATWDELIAGHRQVRVRPIEVERSGHQQTCGNGLMMVTPLAPKPNGRRSKRPWHELRLRIGRDARGDDQSRWVAVRFVLHRPIPADARIQQV